MFIRVIDYKLVDEKTGMEPDDSSKAATVKTKAESLYECHSVSKKWVDRKSNGETVQDLMLTMEGGGNISLQLERRQGLSIYFMNDAGRTIDSIHW